MNIQKIVGLRTNNEPGFSSLELCSLILMCLAFCSSVMLVTTRSSPSPVTASLMPRSEVAPYPGQDEQKVYRKPRWNDQRLDWCFLWGKDCGQPAADHFCRRRRFTGARDFRAEPNVGTYEPTRVAGSDQVCNQPFCTGFEYITCFGPLPPEQVFAPPVWPLDPNKRQYRLDWCLNWENDCGKPAADAFCRANGFPESIFYISDPGVGTQPTMLIGTGQICNASFCTAFQMITCKPKPKPLGKATPEPTPRSTPPPINRTPMQAPEKGQKRVATPARTPLP